MADGNSSGILADVKNYLDITWQDEQADAKLAGMIKRGMDAISGKVGECNFYEETQERALLFDYVLYARSGELPQFWKNYTAEIVSLQIDRKVKEYAGDTESI